MEALITKATGSWFTAKVGDKEYMVRLRGKLRELQSKSTSPVVVGDYVIISGADDEKVVEEILPRKNCIVRKSNKLSKQHQLIAANIDLAALVIAPYQPRTPQGFIDRFLAVAMAYQVPAVLLLNKKDLHQQKTETYREYLMETYDDLGYDIKNVSFLDSTDIQEIRDLFEDKTVLLSGNSGVGKSTLANALDPTVKQKIGNISTSYHKGQHTTTFAQMFCLNENIRIIDTPGIKDFGLIFLESAQLNHYFVEINHFSKECKFNNCTHRMEPNCAVMLAVEEGLINENRYLNYVTMFEELVEGEKESWKK